MHDNTPHLLSMMAYSLEAFWPAILGMAAVAAVSLHSRLPVVTGRRICALAILFSSIACFAIAAWKASDPTSTLLRRDVIGFLVFGGAIPTLGWLSAELLPGTRRSMRALIGVVAGLLLLAVSPLILLLVHCSSGDCL